MPGHVRRVKEEIERLAARVLGNEARRSIDEAGFRRALVAGYPDRIGRRRAPGSPRVLLCSGHGAVVLKDSGVHEGEFLVAIDVQAGARGVGAEARIRVASRVEREWLQPTRTETVHRFDPDTGHVKAFVVEWYDALPLEERATDPDPAIAAGLLATAWLERGPGAQDARLIRRLRFAGQQVDIEALVRRACGGARSLEEIALSKAVDVGVRRTLDRLDRKSVV